MLKEISVTKILQTIQVLKANAKQGMTKNEWDVLKNRNSHFDYDSNYKRTRKPTKSLRFSSARADSAFFDNLD